MSTLNFTIKIDAPKEKVWDTMLDKKTYEEWTAVFHEGSTYEGSWDEGSTVRFVSEDDGKASGMLGVIAENRPYEYLSIEYTGEVVDGKDDTTSDEAKRLIGSHENYSFREDDGVTTLTIELESDGMGDDLKQMFAGMWPPALAKLKELAEEA